MQTYPPRLTNQVIAEIGMTGWVNDPFFCLDISINSIQVQKLPSTFLDKKVAKNLRDGFYTLRFTPFIPTPIKHRSLAMVIAINFLPLVRV
jgi:hypothetical protein